MRKLLLLLTAFAPFVLQAQVSATFEFLNLSKPDTFYVNYSDPGHDVGFNDASLHFPCIYDTAFGGLWSAGFVYSNMTDSVTSGYTNMYAAKTGIGYNNSNKYAVYWAGYGAPTCIKAQGPTFFAPAGFYITNSTYAYNSMKNGDAFPAKKFGGATGNDPEWFKVVIRGYSGGLLKPDSVEYYLADFRFANNAQDYIIKDWSFVNLQLLHGVDSLQFTLSSSDNDPLYGMNTPAYFCMDNFTANIPTSVGQTPVQAIAKVFPNPATNQLFVTVNDATITKAIVYDAAGKIVAIQSITGATTPINIDHLAAGLYLLKLEGAHGMATVRFIKQ